MHEDLKDRQEKQDGAAMFGRIAVQFDILTRDSLSRCLKAQRDAIEAGENAVLGEVAVKAGLMTREQANRIAIVQAFMEARVEDRHFGEIAVSNSFITREQLDDALMMQKKDFKSRGEMKRIGDVLQELRYLGPQQVDAILKAQARLNE